jgi:hypothetical protein
MTALNLQRFLEETGISLHRLATYLQVAESYLAAAAAGTDRLTRRDETACRYLRRRLTKWRQLDLPFAESLETFSRDHARSRARARAKTAAKAPPRRPRGRPSSPETTLQGLLLPPSASE